MALLFAHVAWGLMVRLRVPLFQMLAMKHNRSAVPCPCRSVLTAPMDEAYQVWFQHELDTGVRVMFRVP